MGNLSDPKERQKFLLEQVNLNRQQRSTSQSHSLLVLQTDILARLMEMLEGKEEMEYRQLCRLLWRGLSAYHQPIDMKPWVATNRAA